MNSKRSSYHKRPIGRLAVSVWIAFALIFTIGLLLRKIALAQNQHLQAGLSCNGALYSFTPRGGRIAVSIRLDPQRAYGPLLPIQTVHTSLIEVVLDFPRGGQTSLPIIQAKPGSQDPQPQDPYEAVFTLGYHGGIPLAFISDNQTLQGEIILPQFPLPPSRATVISACGSSASFELTYSIWEYEPLWPYVIVP
jgi:hypothetical protein